MNNSNQNGNQNNNQNNNQGSSGNGFVCLLVAGVLLVISGGAGAATGAGHGSTPPHPISTVCNQYFKGGC